jgi:DNA-binding response OmpR family regulator
VLVVDPDRGLHDLVAAATPQPRRTELIVAPSTAAAADLLAHAPVDLAVIDSDLPDNLGIDFARQLKRDHRTTHTVLVTHKPSVDAAVAAIRAGATDFIVKPHDAAAPGDFAARLRAAIARQTKDRRHADRVARLRKLCHRLNDARLDVSRQVDVLCHDLVDAYQELATQLHHVAENNRKNEQATQLQAQAEAERSDASGTTPAHATTHDHDAADFDPSPEEIASLFPDAPGQTPTVLPTPGPVAPDVAAEAFTQLTQHQLDLEQLIRSTLEFLMQQAGPTNAAIFLPSSMDEFSLAGYVNYDCSRDAADLLLQHLADVVAPKIADLTPNEQLHLTDDLDIADWFGPDAAWLADSHVVAFNASAEQEALAIVVLFRDGDEPFAVEQRNVFQAIAPVLGNALARVIRIHHRHLPDVEDWQTDGDTDPHDADPYGSAF